MAAVEKGRYSYIIVGAGIIGSALAYAIATEERKVLLIERDFSEPGIYLLIVIIQFELFRCDLFGNWIIPESLSLSVII